MNIDWRSRYALVSQLISLLGMNVANSSGYVPGDRINGFLEGPCCCMRDISVRHYMIYLKVDTRSIPTAHHSPDVATEPRFGARPIGIRGLLGKGNCARSNKYKLETTSFGFVFPSRSGYWRLMGRGSWSKWHQEKRITFPLAF